jgi:hypothetical protein
MKITLAMSNISFSGVKESHLKSFDFKIAAEVDANLDNRAAPYRCQVEDPAMLTRQFCSGSFPVRF